MIRVPRLPVPSITPAEPLPGALVFAEPSFNLPLRMALYEASDLNLAVNCGPMSLCYFSPRARYLVFKLINEGAPATSAAYFKKRGIPIGCDWPFAGRSQHLVWEDDSAAVLEAEFARLMTTIEATEAG